MSLASGQLRVKAVNLARRLVPTVVASLLLGSVVSADEGWLIERFTIRLDIQQDGSIAAREALDVDFPGLSRHGIFRDIFYLFTYDETYNRRYDITLTEVTAAAIRSRTSPRE